MRSVCHSTLKEAKNCSTLDEVGYSIHTDILPVKVRVGMKATRPQPGTFAKLDVETHAVVYVRVRKKEASRVCVDKSESGR